LLTFGGSTYTINPLTKYLVPERASLHKAAVVVESIPPDNPITTPSDLGFEYPDISWSVFLT